MCIREPMLLQEDNIVKWEEGDGNGFVLKICSDKPYVHESSEHTLYLALYWHGKVSFCTVQLSSDLNFVKSFGTI